MTTFPPRTNPGQTEHRPSPSAAWQTRTRDLDAGVHAIVLAGSHRWGGSAFDSMLRGPLVPIALTPVIAYPLAWLRGAMGTATICANHTTDAVRRVFADGQATGMRLDYYEDETPRGPAGCAADAARRTAAHTFVIVEGALVPALVELRALLRAHRDSGAAATIVVEIERRRRTLAPDRRKLPGGVYVLDRRVLEQVPARGYHDIKEELLDRLFSDRERVGTFEVQGVTPRVLDFASYTSVSQWMIGRALADPARLPGFVRDDASARHGSAVVDRTARIVGPVLLGHDVRIERDAVIVGPTAIADGSRVGAGAVITRSNLWHGCTVGEGARVDAGLLADGARVGPNSVVEWEAIVGDGADALRHTFEPLPSRAPSADEVDGDARPATAARLWKREQVPA